MCPVNYVRHHHSPLIRRREKRKLNDKRPEIPIQRWGSKSTWKHIKRIYQCTQTEKTENITLKQLQYLNIAMTSLFLQEGKAPTVKVHPGVIFSILDHYRRRNTGSRRVVGTLLGNKVNNIIEVQTCFAVPHTEEGQISIGGTYNQQMVELKTAVNDLEVVGWYATAVGGETMGFTSAILHGYYERELSIVNPIHLLVDAELTLDKLSVRTFVCNTLTLGNDKLAANCQEVKTVILSDPSEKTAVDFMMKNLAAENSNNNNNNNNNSIDGEDVDPKKQQQIVHNNIKTLERSIARLLSMLERVSAYVNDATKNPDKRDSSLAYLIESALSSVPRINPEQFDKMFNNSLQDMLMITYLTNLMRAQLAIADKLSDCDRLLEA